MIFDNPDFKSLLKSLDTFYGSSKATAFNYLLDYIVYGFCLNAGLPDWPYDKEESAKFREMFRQCVLTIKTELDKEHNNIGWCDVFGNIHQTCLYSKTGKGFLGQFFSPEHICNCMTAISLTDIKKKDTSEVITVNDPCCGSGRMLLAAHTYCQKEHRMTYCTAKDICLECVKMTTANFLLHGVVGEVVWGDSLNPEDGRLCFLVNENLNNPFSELFGIPHCRVAPYEQTMQSRTFVRNDIT